MVSPLIRFYDNDKLNIKHFKEQLKYVEPIFVDNSPNKEILNGFPASLYTTKFLEKYPDNKFALYLKSLNNYCITSLCDWPTLNKKHLLAKA